MQFAHHWQLGQRLAVRKMRGALRLAEATVVLLLVRLLIRTALGPLMRWTLRPAGLLAPPRPVQHGVARVVRRAAAALPGDSLCLAQAICGKWLLARRGYRSEVHLGVSLDRPGTATLAGKRLSAHAWLEAGGPILTGAEAAGRMSRIGG